MNHRFLLARFGRFMWWCGVSLANFGLLFRSLIWASWLPHRDEPYGAADILEVLIWFGILGLCAVCLVVGLIVAAFPTVRDSQLATKLLITGVILPVVYYFDVPTFRLWG